MFDDINVNPTGKVPGNLPVSEPDDIFAATEASDINQSSAVSVGKLQPKASVASMPAPSLSEPSEPKVQTIPEESYGLNKIKNPIFARKIMILFIVLVGLGILGGGSWLVYIVFVKPADEVGDFILPDNIETPKTEKEVIAPKLEDDAVLFGEPVDTDSDNLTDSREEELGTNLNDWDSDNDEVSDGDEVLVWKSNPLNPDTDGDSFFDGAEIKNGYNPVGPGKIFEASKL